MFNKPNLKLSDLPRTTPTKESAKPVNDTHLDANPTTAISTLTNPCNESHNNLTKYLDTSGRLNFTGKAVLHAQGADFTHGASYAIRMQDLEICEELGRGYYGTVYRVLHRPTGVWMAMKEIKLEITDAAFRQIIMELEVLHRSSGGGLIVEFYGAFFLEGAVYLCMEYMDCGSLETILRHIQNQLTLATSNSDKAIDAVEDKQYGGLEERILAEVAHEIVCGLKYLKDKLSVIHRDVKPSNVLLNSQGQVKLCDFGVSGQLVQSMAKTNIGCQSYMAPERIAILADHSTYTVSSDVWSLGVTLWEAAMGHHPFSADRYDSVFAQLNAIVTEQIESVDSTRFSPNCQDFLSLCLEKDPNSRPNYATLLQHPFIANREPVDLKQWLSEIML